MKVLFCDDAQAILSVAKVAVPLMWEEMWPDLRDRGFDPPSIEIETVSDGAQAIERIKDDPPDVFMLDLRMPGMSGEDVARYLKGQPETRDIPIIAVSAFTDEREIADALRSEDLVADIQPKPWQYCDLLASILQHSGYEGIAEILSTLRK